MPEVHIIYISETDLWQAGRTTYPVKKHFAGTDVMYNDGIHFLKREEGGFEVMCQITEKFLQEGRQEQARETVLNLAEMGMPVEKIAAAVKVRYRVPDPVNIRAGGIR